jgi:hypothetical protein
MVSRASYAASAPLPCERRRSGGGASGKDRILCAAHLADTAADGDPIVLAELDDLAYRGLGGMARHKGGAEALSPGNWTMKVTTDASCVMNAFPGT